MISGETTITLALLLTVVSAVISILNFIDNRKKHLRNETHDDTAAFTTLVVKLETMQDSIRDLKSDMQNSMSDLKKDLISVKNDLNDFRERIKGVETKVQMLSQRCDQLEIKRVYEKEK